MSEFRISLFVCASCCLLATGCAQTAFRAGSLPAQFAAAPVRDYSALDLTSYTRSDESREEIMAGDRLQVRLNSGVWGESSDQVWSVDVDPDGTAVLPHIGPVRLAGFSSTQAQQTIVDASIERDVFLTPVVNVRVEARERGVVQVGGAVGKPGSVQVLGEEISLADAIVRAGGLTKNATGMVSVSGSVARGEESESIAESSERVIRLDRLSPAELAEITIPIGTTVSVQAASPRQIKVIGVIDNTSLEIPAGREMRLLDALTLAGGPRYSGWILDKVEIIRTIPGRNETVRIQASIRGAKSNSNENILLAPNDIVSVEENPMTFSISTLNALFGVGRSAAILAGAP